MSTKKKHIKKVHPRQINARMVKFNNAKTAVVNAAANITEYPGPAIGKASCLGESAQVNLSIYSAR